MTGKANERVYVLQCLTRDSGESGWFRGAYPFY
jgi:hypothetical protein